MITIETAGQEYRGFTEISVVNSLDTLSGQFSFLATTKNDDILPIKRDETCIIRVEGETVMTGFVEKINVKYSGDSHRLIIEGRDKTADVIDSC